MLRRVISGGQTGVDRAALDAARRAGLELGGWCPRGRRAEDGPVPQAYPLRETPEADYAQRTEWNVRDADATLVIAPAPPSGGTAFTVRCAEALGGPYRVVAGLEAEAADVARWIADSGIAVLNVAGPRESQAPGIGALTGVFLDGVFAAVKPRAGRGTSAGGAG